MKTTFYSLLFLFFPLMMISQRDFQVPDTAETWQGFLHPAWDTLQVAKGLTPEGIEMVAIAIRMESEASRGPDTPGDIKRLLLIVMRVSGGFKLTGYSEDALIRWGGGRSGGEPFKDIRFTGEGMLEVAHHGEGSAVWDYKTWYFWNDEADEWMLESEQRLFYLPSDPENTQDVVVYGKEELGSPSFEGYVMKP